MELIDILDFNTKRIDLIKRRKAGPHDHGALRSSSVLGLGSASASKVELRTWPRPPKPSSELGHGQLEPNNKAGHGQVRL